MPRLLACSACHRHVNADATRCPFCSFGPLFCAATPSANWLLTLSMAVGSLALLGCDDTTKQPTSKDQAPEASTGAVKDPATDEPSRTTADEPNQTTSAEPPHDRTREPEPDIYGGPRMMDPEPEPEPEPPKPIYGAPRQDPPVPVPKPSPK